MISWTKNKLKGNMTVRTETAEANTTMMATTWAISSEKNKSPVEENKVPEQYAKYQNVFSEEEAKRYPPTREEDHAIKFTSEVPKFFETKVYQMPYKQVIYL